MGCGPPWMCKAGLGWAGLCGAGDQPCCGNPGARAGGPRGADVGSWVIGALITNGTVILTNTYDDNNDSQRVDLIVEAVTHLLPPWWPVGHGKEVRLHASQSLVQWCWWGVGCLIKSASFCVPFWLAVHSQTFTAAHLTVCPGLALCCPIPNVAAGAWSLEWKATLEALCFAWLFLWKSWEWWLVDQWEYGDFHWPLSLGLLGKPAEENFSFLLHLVSWSLFHGGRGSMCMWMRRHERLSPKQIYRESIASYFSAESNKQKLFCLVHMIKLSTTGMEKAAQEASCCAKGCDVITVLLGLSCLWRKVCNKSFVFH